MKFSYDILNKLVDGLPPKQKLVEILSAHVFEVESIKGDTIDISLPANRYSDASSHLGIAREISAVLNEKLHDPVKKSRVPEKKGLIKVDIKDKDLCLRYSARVFDLNKIPETPTWMKKALQACGINSINGIVDIMNYVMIEVGQPLHAFDYEKIEKGIVVRRAEKGEKIDTLDGGNFSLSSDVLVIADHKHPQAIAGIKGGSFSGVTKETKRIIVEAASFDSVNIYKTSKGLKLDTDASLRFGHGLSPVLVEWGMERATELLEKGGAKAVDSIDVYPRPVGSEIIEFRPERYGKVIGDPVSADEAAKIFVRRGFSIHQKKKDSLLVKVPAWRTDISMEEDLIEEIVRVKGLNNLKPIPPTISIKPAQEDEVVVFKERIREILGGLNLTEIYSYSFVGEKEPEVLELLNPISKDFAYLRRDLKKGILKGIDGNRKYFDSIRIFEIGHVFKAGLKQHSENVHLAIALANKKDPRILEMKGVLREMMLGLGITDYSSQEEGGKLRLEVGGKMLGEAEVIHLEKGWITAYAEINLTKLIAIEAEDKEFKPFSKFPAVTRDVSLMLESHARIGEVIRIMQEAAPKYVEDIDLIDEYADEKLGGELSVTLRIVFQAEDRTLTDEEVNTELDSMLQAVRNRYRIEVR